MPCYHQNNDRAYWPIRIFDLTKKPLRKKTSYEDYAITFYEEDKQIP